MATSLYALDAVVQVEGAQGARSIPIADFHRLPGDTPHIDTNLRGDDFITAIDLPAEHHNPIEPHATIAMWDGDNLTVYDATQSVSGTRQILAEIFGTRPANASATYRLRPINSDNISQTIMQAGYSVYEGFARKAETHLHVV